MILRVFISYSHQDSRSAEIRDALAEALLAEPKRFGLLADVFTLEPGDAWRSRINLWVGGCDAAVVLLSREALKSPYVVYENSVLAYRSALDPASLLILPVLLDDVDVKALKEGFLYPSQLEEKQAISGDLTTEEIVSKVMDRLSRAQRCNAPTPIEKRALRLADLFKGVDDAVLLEAGREIDLDLEPWSLHSDLALRLALQLLSVGMQAALPALLIVRQHLPMAERAQRMELMIDLVASSWVDPRSVARLAERVKAPPPTRAVGINGRRTWTAKMYTLSASRDSRIEWHLASCDGVFGEDAVETLKEKLRRALMAELKSRSADDLREDLAALEEPPQQPVLVAFHHAGITRTVLTELRNEFPTVTFVVLTGEIAEGVALDDATLELLIPRLYAGDEDACFNQYDRFERKVRIR
jgi:hypothetical protein